MLTKKPQKSFKRKKSKRWFLSVVEEFWPGQKERICIGRVEVFDNKLKSPYPVSEGRIVASREVFEKIREIFDFKEFEGPLEIQISLKEEV